MYYKKDLGYKYPDRSDEHMITVKHLRDTHFDEHYPYLDKSFFYKVKRVVLWILLNTIVFPIVTIRHGLKIYGKENLPKEDGFLMYSNHQGLFDVLVFLESCPVPFAFVIKKEASNIILLKQVIAALKSISIDREDIRQSMQVINEVAEEVKKGRNFLIFAEGTRSKMGNKPLPFKGGTFKSAVKAKCPIVPCALIDSFKPFDVSSIAPVTVKLVYLPPIPYEEYCGMKTPEIAEMVKQRIETAISEYENK